MTLMLYFSYYVVKYLLQHMIFVHQHYKRMNILVDLRVHVVTKLPEVVMKISHTHF